MLSNCALCVLLLTVFPHLNHHGCMEYICFFCSMFLPAPDYTHTHMSCFLKMCFWMPKSCLNIFLRYDKCYKLYFILCLTVLKNGGRQTAQLTECDWPRDFSHNECVCCLHSPLFLTQVHFWIEPFFR